MKFCCCFFVSLIAAGFGFSHQRASADIVLPKIFCDHMVLQRNSTVPVFGTATPEQTLVVTFQEQEISVTADSVGNWTAQLETHEAGGPYEINIVATGEDAKIVIHDVMIGDVWICSGQSNMARSVSMAMNGEAEIEQSKKCGNLRLFRIEEHIAASPENEFGKVEPWQVCSPESVKDFSATGYFFGRELSRRIENVPIGLISAAVGGTPCEAWVSREKLESVELLKPLLEHWDQNEANSHNRPAYLFNGMIAPLRHFPVRGVAWYQGEANVGRASQYLQLFPALIEDWRDSFSQPELPFFFAQLAPFRYSARGPESLPALWEAQLQTLKAVPKTGMAVLTDIGDLDDIHPPNKQEVGRRLALLALETYAADEISGATGMDWSGPVFEEANTEDGSFRIRFSGCKSGLQIAGESETLNGFTICGEDKSFVPANAVIAGDTVIVTSEQVPNPQAVRFGWDLETPMNLVNGEGLPASPFRTDKFEVNSANANF